MGVFEDKNICSDVAAFVIPFNLLCNMAMF